MELKRAVLTPRNRALSLGTASSDNPPLSMGRRRGQRQRGIVERGGDIDEGVAALAGLGGDTVRRGGVIDKWGGDTLREHL